MFVLLQCLWLNELNNNNPRFRSELVEEDNDYDDENANIPLKIIM